MGQDIAARGLALRTARRLAPMPEDFGASPDAPGVLNVRAFHRALGSGAGQLRLAEETYALALVPIDDPVRNYTGGQQPNIIIPPDFRLLDGGGARVIFEAGRGIMAAAFRTWAYPATGSYLAADVAAGATTLTLEAGQGAHWSIGDVATWRLGSVPDDLPETFNWGFARIAAVSGDVVTLDRPMPEPFVLSSVDGQGFADGFGNTVFNKALYKWPLIEEFEMRDLRIEGHADTAAYLVDAGIKVQGGRNITIRNCSAHRVGTGFSLQYVDGARIENCLVADANTFQQSVGKGISLAEARDITIINPRFRGIPIGISMEAGAEATVIGGTFEHSDVPPAAYNPTHYPFIVGSRSKLTVRDFTLTGYGGYSLAALGDSNPALGGTVRFEGRLTMIHPTPPNNVWVESLDCLLDYRIAGTRELWDFRNTKVWRARFNLKDGTTHTARGPRGQPKTIRVYASPGLTFGTGNLVTSFRVGRPASAGNDSSAQLEAGKTVKFDQIFIGGGDSVLWANRSEQMQVRAVTAAGGGLDANDEFIDVEIEYAMDLLNTDTTWSAEEHARRAGPDGALREALFTAYDLPSIAANGTLQVDFAIPDMLVGDIIEGLEMDLLYAGLSVRSMEARPALCRVIMVNTTATAIDKAAQTIRIAWRRTAKG